MNRINTLNFFLPLLRELPLDMKKYLSQRTIDMPYINLLRMARVEAKYSFNPGLEEIEMEAVAIDVAFHWNNKDGIITKASLREKIGIAAVKYLNNAEKSIESEIETKPITNKKGTQEIVSKVQNEAMGFLYPTL